MSNENGKFGPNAVWLFALGTLAAVLGVTKIIPHVVGMISPKAMAAVYFTKFGAGATAAAYFGLAGAVRTIGAFTAASVGLGIFYYVIVARTFASVGSGIATSMGLVFSVAFAVDALAAGIAGTLFGLKLRRGLARPVVARS